MLTYAFYAASDAGEEAGGDDVGGDVLMMCSSPSSATYYISSAANPNTLGVHTSELAASDARGRFDAEGAKGGGAGGGSRFDLEIALVWAGGEAVATASSHFFLDLS
jgi:hypothetical protein